MGMQEKLIAYLRQQDQEKTRQEQEIRESIANSTNMNEFVFQSLEVVNQLEGIRDDIWKAGKIYRTDIYGYGIELRAGWNVFKPAGKDFEDNYFPNRVDLRKISISLSVGEHVPVLWGKTSEGGYDWFKWDGKTFRVTFDDDYISGGDYKNVFIVDISKPLDQGTKEYFDSCLMQKCKDLLHLCPIPRTIEIARQEIIQRLLQGDLKRADLPRDFVLPSNK